MQQQVLGNIYSGAMAQFSTCRQPWNSYINMLTKEDSQPFAAPLSDKPAYRGRKNGREGWLFGQQSQLHYHMYSDERVFANLTRWRQGDTVGDLAIQQFRSTQPFNMEDTDPMGLNKITPETYLKLNYKNPATFSRFLTRSGSMYPRDILPINPEAHQRIRIAKNNAVAIGLYPRAGNPFWHRTQQFRPKANGNDTYDPLSTRTKDVMEHFAFNWLQTDRIRRYFQEMQSAANTAGQGASQGSGTSAGANTGASGVAPKTSPQMRISPKNGSTTFYNNEAVPFSSKNPTVPGLMSVAGMRKKPSLYNSGGKKRFGFPNPLFGMRKN